MSLKLEASSGKRLGVPRSGFSAVASWLGPWARDLAALLAFTLLPVARRAPYYIPHPHPPLICLGTRLYIFAAMYVEMGAVRLQVALKAQIANR